MNQSGFQSLYTHAFYLLSNQCHLYHQFSLKSCVVFLCVFVAICLKKLSIHTLHIWIKYPVSQLSLNYQHWLSQMFLVELNSSSFFSKKCILLSVLQKLKLISFVLRVNLKDLLLLASCLEISSNCEVSLSTSWRLFWIYNN